MVTGQDFERSPQAGIEEGGRGATGLELDTIRGVLRRPRILLTRLAGAFDPRLRGSVTVPRVHSPKPVTAEATLPAGLRRLCAGRAARLWTPGGSSRGFGFLVEALA
jgi:hypothetical protein